MPQIDQDKLFALFNRLGGATDATLDTCGRNVINSFNCNTQRATEKVYATYAIVQVNVGDLELIPGVRYEHTDIHNTFWVTPTVNGVTGTGAFASNVARFDAFERDVKGLDPYRRLGFIPSYTVAEAASKTLEYAYDDWAMATLAEVAGAPADAEKLRARSRNYRNLFDAKTGFIRPRLADGGWAEPFDPPALGHDTNHWRDFTECNAWQATFGNQHDVYGLIDLFGGDAAFEAKLDALFAADSAIAGESVPDITGLVGQYAHGNEPSHHVAYLYAYCGGPWKTQARVRMLMAGQYRAAPDGLSGNEDCGQMSAWYLMSAMGLYPVDPVSGTYVFGAPLFARATLDVGGGRRVVIEAPGVAPDAVYVSG